MGKCFVIQPFDGGKFDKRYEDVFAPAVAAAKLDPYRVDRDPSVSIPIDEIQSGIESSEICLADITTDNPNVWFELGYAIALKREVVLVCSTERTTRFPFDVQHRSILRYATDSSSDFEKLLKDIRSKLVGVMSRRNELEAIAKIESVAKVEGLDQHEVAALVSVAEEMDEPEHGVSALRVRQAMENAGFTKVATTLGLRALLDNKMVETVQNEDYNGSTFTAYRVTSRGMQWLLGNRERLTLRTERLKQDAKDYFADKNDLPF